MSLGQKRHLSKFTENIEDESLSTEQFVQSYLKHGKVVLWTETKADPQSKVDILKMKRILGEQNIDFEVAKKWLRPNIAE